MFYSLDGAEDCRDPAQALRSRSVHPTKTEGGASRLKIRDMGLISLDVEDGILGKKKVQPTTGRSPISNHADAV
jgi:hypothetical protein